ncbi:hypothetical protein BDK51DRAFT_33245 [Blyttiomyces helicus]|uniref:Uncharacterized protein n=1 Tax=Blyttiomyces helicus TaxID=388810 RepID=A0A4P9VXC0_9FUNG|nr:hypothetical protein BDK51DRAFT_33245 [Blyttiomyces helicus]|eukprot:RKO83892.1 hypothetical protein BDK51DRAFT_33245 [Blyttiomyces helicus]
MTPRSTERPSGSGKGWPTRTLAPRAHELFVWNMISMFTSRSADPSASTKVDVADSKRTSYINHMLDYNIRPCLPKRPQKPTFPPSSSHAITNVFLLTGLNTISIRAGSTAAGAANGAIRIAGAAIKTSAHRPAASLSDKDCVGKDEVIVVARNPLILSTDIEKESRPLMTPAAFRVTNESIPLNRQEYSQCRKNISERGYIPSPASSYFLVALNTRYPAFLSHRKSAWEGKG